MKRPILSTAFILATLMGSTIMAKADNLKDALTTAYINNPSLGAARASQRATDETVNQATGGWRPQIIGSGSMARTDGSRTGVGFLPSQQITKPKSIGISIEQPVFRSFQTVNGTREARAQATAGRAQLENVEQQVFMATVQAYSDVIRDEAFLEFTTTNVVALQRNYRQVKTALKLAKLPVPMLHNQKRAFQERNQKKFFRKQL